MKKYLITTPQQTFAIWTTPDMLPLLKQTYGKGCVEEAGRSITELVTDYIMFAKPELCKEWVTGSKEEADKSFFLDTKGIIAKRIDAWLIGRIDAEKIAGSVQSYVNDGGVTMWLYTLHGLAQNEA